MNTKALAYEKLGVFYLGRPHDPATGLTQDVPLLYDSADLVTHAVCVGMTGSGKTGLCISLLEEAAIDGIPALVIDPKGDLGNLLLTFPGLQGEDFLPWINEEDAQRQGQTAAEYAAQQAALWQQGLADWDQDGERIRRLRAAADFAIFTPGSSAGLPVSILASFQAPPPALREDREALNDRIATTAGSLLGLLGIAADPLRSREHILLASLFDAAWRAGRDLELASLIEAIQDPPLARVGVMPLETFYPAKERFELAMALNNLLAAPGFASWLEGTPLDLNQLLYTQEGKPRIAIMALSHLSDEERMFVVSLLLDQALAWMRSRPGTTSLRALLYMDEIFGYLPPVANPPSKRPLLTLLKQARAFGLGLVLATQNPVDLDYKALSNIGTWFLGRLQTERDQERVLDGLESAAGGGFSRQDLARLLSGLKKRVFLLHNVHEDGPVTFQVRWAMSYLRGPLTRQQIQRLTAERQTLRGTADGGTAGGATPPTAGGRPTPSGAASPASTQEDLSAARPLLPPGVPQRFLPAAGGSTGLTYLPALLGLARVRFVDAKRGVDSDQEVALLTELAAEPTSTDWDRAQEVALSADQLAAEPAAAARYGALPAPAGDAKNYKVWEKDLVESLYRNRAFELLKSPTFDLTSSPGESRRDFLLRVADQARVERDRETAKLRQKYAQKADALRERIRRAEQKLEREQQQSSQKKIDSMVAVGTTLLGAFLGRRKLSLSRVSSAARGFGRSAKEASDVDRAEEDLASLQQELDALNAELESEILRVGELFEQQTQTLESVALKPRRGDIDIRLITLVWVPQRAAADGTLVPACPALQSAP